MLLNWFNKLFSESTPVFGMDITDGISVLVAADFIEVKPDMKSNVPLLTTRLHRRKE